MRTRGHVVENDIMVTLLRHRAYIKGDVRGQMADFSFKDISNIVLENESFESVSFRGSNLAKAVLRYCDLTGADFFGADLEGADLTGSNLTGADFRGANLYRATLSNTNLRSADFRVSGGQDGSIGRNACLSEAKIDHAILCQANLAGCDMSGADLVDADLSGADLTQTVLLGADLTGASLAEARLNNTVLELSRLNEQQIGQLGSTDGIVKPTYKSLSVDEISRLLKNHGHWVVTGGAKGERLCLDGVDIAGANIETKSLAGAILRRCNLSSLKLNGKIFDMADLSYSSIVGSNLEGASLRGANLRGADLSKSILRSARFDQMPLEASRQWSANLDQAILCDADLTGASFTKSVMTNTDIRGCVVCNTAFIGVDLSKTKLDARANIAAVPDKRAYHRYSEPQLYVKTAHGVYNALNWSLGGVCLIYHDEDRLEVGEEIWASIVAKDNQPPRQTQFTVIRDMPEKGLVYLKFSCISDEVNAYIGALALKSVEIHKGARRS